MVIMTLRYNKRSYQITIPKKLIDFLGWKAGDHILFELDGESIRLKRVNKRNVFKSALELLEDQGGIKSVVYTIGYEGKTISNFIDILQKHGIKLLVDVRELPLSRKNGFSKTRLKEMLNKAGIEYLSIRELGAPKDLRLELKGRRVGFEKFRRQYEEHLNNNINAVKRLEELARTKPTAIMCYEADWRVCKFQLTETTKKLKQNTNLPC